MAANEDFKELDITTEEFDRLQQALKDEQFRKLFVEYAEEISNPENRKKYEEEIAALERNRGMDVKFINPEPGFVVKTSIDGDRKAFINIAQNQNVQQPKSKFATQNGKSGYQWTIPHSLSPSREDLDKTGNKCAVFDCVFHPECFKIAGKDPQFKQMIQNTAFDAIEREFKVKLDRNNSKQLKNMKYKGRATPTVIRTTAASASSPEQGQHLKKDAVSALNLPYPYDNKNTDVNCNKTPRPKLSNGERKMPSSQAVIDENESGDLRFTTPKYTITHRGVLDMEQFVNTPDSRPSTRPQELVIRIALPLLKSASGIKLDVFERRLYLESITTVSYKLDISLPFPVDENNGSAKFDKSKSNMVVTLPVLPIDTPPLPSFSPSVKEKLVEEVNCRTESNKTSDGIEAANSAVNNTTSNASAVQDVKTSGKTSLSESSQSKKDGNMNITKQIDHSEEHAAVTANEKNCSGAEDFTCPEFSFHQSPDTVSVIVDVEHSKEIQSKLTLNGRECWLQIQTEGTEMFGLQLVFPEGSAVDHVTYDASSHNVVFVLHKERDALGEWQSFMAGYDENNLQLKEFTTQSNLLKSFIDLSDQTPSGESAKKVLKSAKVIDSDENSAEQVIELEIGPKSEPTNEDHSTGIGFPAYDDGQLSSDVSSPAATESLNEGIPGVVSGKDNPESVKVKSSINIPQVSRSLIEDNLTGVKHSFDARLAEAQLNIDISGSDVTESTSSPSITSPLSPHSLLKSSFRSHRQRSSKSVSFSDEVDVGTFTPAHGRKGRKKSPYIRRSKTKLKAPAQEVCSDSELVLSCKDADDSEEDLWNIVPPRRALHRQSSSESESDCLGSPKGKHKKAKGSRQRRKERARRALITESSTEESENGVIKEMDDVFRDTSSNIVETGSLEEAQKNASETELSSSTSLQMSSVGDGDSKNPEDDDTEGQVERDPIEDVEGGEWTTVTKKRHHKSENGTGTEDCDFQRVRESSKGQSREDNEEDGGWVTVTKKTDHKSHSETRNGTPKSGDGEPVTSAKNDLHHTGISKLNGMEKDEEKVDVDLSGGPGETKQNGQKDEDLDKLDHHTESSVKFSNKVMFDLDD